MDLYVYGDETEYEVTINGTPTLFVGSGLFVTRNPITPDLIDEALHELESDPDRHKAEFRAQDQTTLDRRYFHAADDSQNGHSWLTRGIVGRLNGTFLYSTVRCSEQDQNAAEAGHRGVGAFQEIELDLAALGVLQREVRLHFTLEGRGSLNAQTVTDWLNRLWELIEQSVFHVPYDLVCFPNANVVVAGKEEPGLQVVDFMIWARNRCHQTPSDVRCFEWLTMQPEVVLNSDKDRASVFHLGEPAVLQCETYPDTVQQFALDLARERGMSKSECFRRYCVIEGELRRLDATALPAHSTHFSECLAQVQASLRANA